MSSASRPLYELQQIDSQLESTGVRLTQVRRQLAGDPKLAKAEKNLEVLASQRKQSQLQLRTLEAKAEDLAARAKHLNDTLYGGLVRDAREMKALESEIAHAKEEQSAFEDEEIAIMERLESLDRDLGDTQSEAEALRAAGESSHGRLVNDEKDLEVEVSAFQRKRDEVATAMDPTLLAKYERMRVRLGHAVSNSSSGVCEWCRVNLPAADIQHARGGTLVTCTNCGRILYAE